MSMIGTRVDRREDLSLLTSGGDYVADVGPADALHAVFVRSTIAHGAITGIDTDAARNHPGVVGVFTAKDLKIKPQPPSTPMANEKMTQAWLATDRVRFVGETVAVVVADTHAAAVDGAELVFVDYEFLDPVVDPHHALAGTTLLFPKAGSNVATGFPGSDDDIFAECDVVTSLTFTNPRLAVAPIEPRGCVSVWGKQGRREQLTQWSSTQFPHPARDALAAGLGVKPADVRVITPDVGGGFGGKSGQYPEDFVVAAAARKLGRAVRWVESRSENMVALNHGRAMSYEATIGGSADGDVQAYQLRLIQDCGAYPWLGAILPMFTRTMASGVYDIPVVDVGFTSVVTNTVPVAAYRGAGRPEATVAIERMMDLFAAEAGLDPVEVRRRNFIAPDAFPFITPTGADMDLGRYDDALEEALAAADYPALRAEQARRRDDPSAPLLGIGVSTYVEITNPMGSSEFSSFEVRPDGSALILTGTASQGQGHHTVWAQIASHVSGIPIERIEVRNGDTAEVSHGFGTAGSRSLQTGGASVMEATRTVVDQARDLAAKVLEANPADIVLDTDNGTFSVAGSPSIAVTWTEVAQRAESDGVVLACESDFQPPGATFPFGAHVAVVEVDRETGQAQVVRFIACDDAGTIVNPTIVDGQVHGGLASGIAQALMETFVYDEDGNPQTGNFMDYGIVSAAELPSFERIPMETPTDRNPLGAKGIGESGTIGSTPAVQSAVIDAIAHLGVRHLDMPLTPQKVWEAISG